MWVGLLNGGTAQTVCVRLNSKNSYGGYTGIRTYAFFFKGETPVIIGLSLDGCQQAAYSAFPEIQSLTR